MSTEAIIVSTSAELMKLGFQTAFQYARMAGLTAEQIEKGYQDAKLRFYGNAPETFPDVPE